MAQARSRSRSASRAHDPFTIDSSKGRRNKQNFLPSSSRRRVTRSQSREVESTEPQNDPHSVPAESGRSRRWGQNQSKGRMSLGVVIEEPSTSSPRRSSFRYGNRVILESPNDAANISGTTILPSEPETDLDLDMMLETLPDLERAAKNVLDFLAPRSADPVSIVNTAKRLGDPKNTQSKRLRRSVSNLAGEAKYFGSQTYIDVAEVNNLFSPGLETKNIRVGKDWSPDPILHKANCARFALEVLLANVGTNSPRHAIKNLEDSFPRPFMNDLAGDEQNKAIGQSSLEKDTFDLALEIRTQSLIIKLEQLQYEPDFNPEAIVRDYFFDQSSSEEDEFESSETPLRGFNIDRLEDANGHLPERFRDAVCDRYNDIRVLLSDEEAGSINVQELRSAYRWQRFVLRAAQWVRKRSQEITRELQVLRSAEDVRKEFFTGSEPRDSLDATAHTPSPTVSRSVGRHEPVLALPPPPSNRPDSVAASETTERRKSSKPTFLNTSSIQRLMQRQQRLRDSVERSETRRQSDFVKPASQDVSGSSGANRRQTLPAFSQSRGPIQEEPREILASPEDSPLFVPDTDPDFLTVSGSHLYFGEHSGSGLERSHSPPIVTNVNREPRRETISTQATYTSDSVSAIPSSQELWKAVKANASARPVVEIRQPARIAFIDRQETAHRVSPISQEPDIRSAERSRVQPPASRKRTRNESEDEEQSSDDDFATYERALNISDKRTEKPEQPRNKRQRVDEEDAEDQSATQLHNGLEETTRSAEQPSQGQSTSANQTQSQEEPSSPKRTARPTEYLPRTATASQKIRTRWTEEQDKRLIRLIGEFGCKWTQIERQNEAQPEQKGEVRFEDRNQVQLKDRARNLKIMFLRQGTKLPKNFDKVTMKAKDYALLEKRRITVSRNNNESDEE